MGTAEHCRLSSLLRLAWLPLSAALFALSSSRYPVPGAYTAALACCLRYSRSHRFWHVLLAAAAAFVGLFVALYGIIGAPGFFHQFLVPTLVTTLVMVPVVLDRALMSAGLKDDAHIVVFALLVAVFSHAAAMLSPYGTIAVPGTEFMWRSSLAQLLSVTGVFGAYFVNAWTAALIAAALAAYVGPQSARRSVNLKGHFAVWALFISCLYVFSGAAYVFAPTNRAADAPAYVRVAGVIIPGPQDYATERWRESIYATTDAAAAAGARVVVWSEWGLRVDTYTGDALNLTACDSGLCDLLARVAAVAVRRQAYVVPSFIADEYTLPGGPEVAGNRRVRSLNNAFVVDPRGEVVLRYTKAHPVMGIEDDIEAGPAVVPTVDTPYGRIAVVICMDLSFPRFLAQAGRQRADLVVAPSEDWPVIYRWTTYLFSLRAAETGATVVRVDNHGRSIVADPYGNVLFEDNYYEHRGEAAPCRLADNATCEKGPYFFVKDVPANARRAALYPWLFEAHAYVAYVAVALLVVLACVLRKCREMGLGRAPIVAALFRYEGRSLQHQPLIA
eukprot:m51a1_g1859 hypothetical protein (559) ;mRNA; r:623117-625256